MHAQASVPPNLLPQTAVAVCMEQHAGVAADMMALLPTLQQVRDSLLLDVSRTLPAERGGGLRELLANAQCLEPLDDGLLWRRLADHCAAASRLSRALSGSHTYDAAQHVTVRHCLDACNFTSDDASLNRTAATAAHC